MRRMDDARQTPTPATECRGGTVNLTRALLPRLVSTVPTLLLIVLLSFLLLDLMPGDPAATLSPEGATPEQIELRRQQLGLDQGILTRFVEYVVNVSTGDFGTSFVTGASVTEMIRPAAPVTASLAVVTMLITIVVGLAAGFAAALNRNRWLDRAITAVAGVAMGVPAFVFSLVLLVAFALNNPWLPATGYQPLSSGFGTWLSFLILPSLALATNSTAELSRQVRGAVIDTLDQDFIRTARANGLPRRSILLKHTLRNSAIPMLTVLGMQLPRIVGSAIVVESIFAMPGLGMLTINAVLGRDIPTVQAIVLITGVVVLLSNLVIDFSYPLINPRLRVQ